MLQSDAVVDSRSGGVEGGIHGLCGNRVAGVGCVGRWCCWLFGVGGACRCVAVVGCCVGYEVAMLGGGRGFADGGFGVVWWGTFGVGWCWWYMYRWVGVGCVGWWLIGGGVGLVRVWHGGITLLVQDLVCDGCRWVAVEGALLVLWAVCGMFAGCG